MRGLGANVDARSVFRADFDFSWLVIWSKGISISYTCSWGRSDQCQPATISVISTARLNNSMGSAIWSFEFFGCDHRPTNCLELNYILVGRYRVWYSPHGLVISNRLYLVPLWCQLCRWVHIARIICFKSFAQLHACACACAWSFPFSIWTSFDFLYHCAI